MELNNERKTMKEEIQETGSASILVTLEGGKIKVTHGTTEATLMSSGGMVKAGTWAKIFHDLEIALS